ncbi:thioredoxin family protein [Carnobacterium gallinarum]|uniref:thioredoxin family protein n=1 Tax=Carnobacterium gallinarum TaxID=2749 RepID=UPI000550B990|nr:thioredoxin family protein [Carnobacterium gallinarum]
MKKLGLLLLFSFMLLNIVTGIMYFDVDKKLKENLTEEKESYPDIYNVLNSITVDNFEKNISNMGTSLVYIGRPTCGDCTIFEPELIKYIKGNSLNQKIVYLNVAKLYENKPAWENFKSLYDIQYTPTIARYSNGKLVSKIEWTPERGISVVQVADWFDENQ